MFGSLVKGILVSLFNVGMHSWPVLKVTLEAYLNLVTLTDWMDFVVEGENVFQSDDILDLFVSFCSKNLMDDSVRKGSMRCHMPYAITHATRKTSGAKN